MTWIASPLFNLLLRLNRFGRLALSREQIITSNWVAGCLVGVLVSLELAFSFRWAGGVVAAFTFGVAIAPISAIYRCHRGWPRSTLLLITVALVAIGAMDALLATAGAVLGDAAPPLLKRVDSGLFSFFILAAIGTQFAANALVSVVPRN
jgi:hypothetical protein